MCIHHVGKLKVRDGPVVTGKKIDNLRESKPTDW